AFAACPFLLPQQSQSNPFQAAGQALDNTNKPQLDISSRMLEIRVQIPVGGAKKGHTAFAACPFLLPQQSQSNPFQAAGQALENTNKTAA
ncbi:MAG: hypothetical protein J6S28_10545, partial [Clostridia bacterium]|nr:hypothetical protein [Clostridia bacterium]